MRPWHKQNVKTPPFSFLFLFFFGGKQIKQRTEEDGGQMFKQSSLSLFQTLNNSPKKGPFAQESVVSFEKVDVDESRAQEYALRFFFGYFQSKL